MSKLCKKKIKYEDRIEVYDSNYLYKITFTNFKIKEIIFNEC